MNAPSPVCVLWCRANSSDRANLLPQPAQEQGNGRSPETESHEFTKHIGNNQTNLSNCHRAKYMVLAKGTSF